MAEKLLARMKNSLFQTIEVVFKYQKSETATDSVQYFVSDYMEKYNLYAL